VTPLPDQDVICLDIGRMKICSKIDLSNAYKQIHIIPEDMHKMVFAMIYGMFVSNIMQQGNCNTPSMFQCAMNSIFCEYIGIVLHVYLDDLFVYSNLVQEHQKHLGMVFIKLRECKGNLTIEHNAQILARRIQSILDKYNTAEGCIPCKGDPKRKL